MNKLILYKTITQQHRNTGFSLLELLIVILILLTLAIITFPLVWDNANRFFQVNEIKNSIELIHEAANMYYYNEILKNNAPKSSLSINQLLNDGYLNYKEIYQLKTNYSETQKQAYNYHVSLDTQNGDEIVISVQTINTENLQDLRPNEYEKTLIKDNSKIYEIETYSWYFKPNLQFYPNMENARLAKSILYKQ